jgi:hypothetical protein
METIDLRRRARRAYELGRISRALGVTPFVLLAAGVAIACGRPPALTGALAAALFALAVGLLAFGGSPARAVGPGLVAGWAALAPPLLLRTAGHACFGARCMSLCLPACAIGGVVCGALLGRLAAREGGGAAWLGAAAVIAGLSGAMGCSLGGSFGILGMLAGFIAGGAPVLALRRS